MKTKIAALSCAVALSSAAAQAAPSQLYGKTVTISLNQSRTFRPAQGGETLSRGYSSQFIIYISEAGRLFVRSDRTVSKFGRGGAAEKAIDTAPGSGTIGVSVSSSAQFSGNSLVLTLRFDSGAARITAGFDATYTGCTATAVYGREGGKNMVIRSRFNGRLNEILAQEVTVTGCSVQNGNAFAGH